LQDAVLDDLAAVVPPLLHALEQAGFVGRYLNPPDLPAVLEAVGEADAPLKAARPRLDAWPDDLAGVRDRLAAAADAALRAFEGLRGAGAAGDVRMAYRALGQLPRAQEALYPLCPMLPPVSRFFLTPARRGDEALVARLAEPAPETGVLHLENETGQKGGVSLYVPETYDPAVPHPLVMALHGGSGHGRSFLWSWLRDARAHGALLAAPTAQGDTWAITGPDPDTPALARMVEGISSRWSIDPTRILLTGMSDGGTFSYVSGLEPGSPFTHLAPVAAAFHPMLAQMADPARMAGLPIQVTHGALDWMFPVAMAREAVQALGAAGAAVSYRELDDLSHTYPREINPQLLAWLSETARRPDAG
jgi:phospholipase/carboxylesterase